MTLSPPPLAASPVYLELNNDNIDIPVAENRQMQSHVSAMQNDIERAYEESKNTNKVVVYVTSGVSASLTAGAATYMLRAGSLMSSFLATVPIWKGFDPVAILTTPSKKKKKGQQQDKTLGGKEETAADQNAESMFEGKDR